MKNKKDFTKMAIIARDYNQLLEQVYENFQKITETIEEIRNDFETRLKSIENKYQSLESRTRYSRIDY